MVPDFLRLEDGLLPISMGGGGRGRGFEEDNMVGYGDPPRLLWIVGRRRLLELALQKIGCIGLGTISSVFAVSGWREKQKRNLRHLVFPYCLQLQY